MPYVIGIDVGGTNTDGALLHDGIIKGVAKVSTNRDHLVSSMTAVFEELVKQEFTHMPEQLELHLSTTLSTNAIVENRGDPTAVLAFPGPGMRIEEMGFPFRVFSLSGSIDHRGREIAPIGPKEVIDSAGEAARAGMRALAGVGKFSVRNPAHELEMERLVGESYPGFKPVALGHRLSGRLSFPRRITTAYLNAAVARRHAVFVRMVREFLGRRRVQGSVFLLKADGGTMNLAESQIRPIETILSGPAASVMGALALSESGPGHAAVLDIGGTTTEISVLIDGQPLLERQGAEIGGYQTVVPALFSRSLGLGGDSRVTLEGGAVRIGPQREGPPAAMGGPAPTPTDAAILLGLLNAGDKLLAARSMLALGGPAGIAPDELARRIVEAFCQEAAAGIRDISDHLASLPAYTISELLSAKPWRPTRIIGMGAPAAMYIPRIAEVMGLSWEVIRFPEAGSAIGAAASRPTAAVTLHADTALARMVVPELDYAAEIPRALLFDARRAREEAHAKARMLAERMGAVEDVEDIDIIEEESFNVVRGFHTAGRIFTVRAQLRPKARRVVVPG